MNMMQKILGRCLRILLLVLFYNSTYAQTEDLDSLVAQLKVLPVNEARADHLNSLAKYILYNDPNQSFIYANEALDLAKELNYEERLGDIYKTLGNIDLAQGDYSDALHNYLLGLEKFRQFGDSVNMANIYNNIGILYDRQENLEEAKKYYNRALDIYESQSDFRGQATIYINLGVSYDNIKEYDSATNYYGKSLVINKELKDESIAAYAFGNLGYAYMNKHIYDTARKYFEQSLQFFKKLNDNDGISNQYSNLGELKIKEGKYEESLEYLKKSEALAMKHGFKSWLAIDYRLLSEAYRELGNYKIALEYHEKHGILSDSISTAEHDRTLYELQAWQENEQAIAILHQEKEIQAQRLRAATLKNYLLIATSGFSLIVMLISAYYFMNKQKTSIQLRKQNEEIMVQQQEIETQRKKVSIANKNLKEKNFKLNSLNKEKDYLLHVVAHDLKSPLNQMAGLTKVIMIEEEKLSDTQKDCLEKIDTVSLRLSHMVDKILDIEAIDQKSYNMNLEETDLREILSETVSDFENTAKRKDIRINRNINGKICLVRLDRHHAMQIFSNLISNAIKFSPPHKEIFVNLIQDEEQIITEVMDQGPGLTSDDKMKVFKKFQKLSAQPTGNEESSGLGLSIVKKYVEAMNGRVWVESENGSGANFKVSFQKI